MPTAVRRYVRSLDLDAYVVGGAVRDELLGIPHADEDFLVPGVDHAGLRAALEPHGRVEDMEVHGQLVGVRLHPDDRSIRALAPAGIELTPPRTERSTGPGHGDFEIVADASVAIEDDMGRRDFTINAIARRLSTGALVDPFGGLGDLARRELRIVTPQSFAEDPLRLLRGLRLVSQLGLVPSGATLIAMRLEAGGLRHVSGERIGGGLTADGMGELSKLLLGRDPVSALRLARETGVLTVLIPEFGPAIGLELESERQPMTLDEHIFAVVRLAAAAEAGLGLRLAALLHDLGKPLDHEDGHAAAGAVIASRALSRFRYPTRLRSHVTTLVRHHSFRLDGSVDERAARRFLAAHGEDVAFDLLGLKHADLGTKRVTESERHALHRFDALVRSQRTSPHRVGDLAIDGNDLIATGLREGPELGRILRALLDAVVDDPSMNERERLSRLARELAQ